MFQRSNSDLTQEESTIFDHILTNIKEGNEWRVKGLVDNFLWLRGESPHSSPQSYLMKAFVTQDALYDEMKQSTQEKIAKLTPIYNSNLQKIYTYKKIT